MLAFIVRRLLQSALVMLTVALVAFTLFRYVGDPVNMLVAQETSLQEKEQIRQRLGLNDPAVVQFARFVAGAMRGDFGISYRQTRPVEELIAERLPATLELSLAAALIALGAGVPLGVYTGLHRDTLLSRALQTLSLIGVSLPTFVTGILLILLFSVTLHWLPAFGRGDAVQLGWWSTGLLTQSGLKALVMPAVTLGLFQLTMIMRLVRSEMIEVLRTDYIKFARARGLRDRTIHFGHALRNTLVPVITIAGLQLGSLIAFSIIVETVFQWPGMGLLFIQAVNSGDFPVLAAYLMLIAFLFVLINLVADLLCYAVDPRLRIDRAVAGQHTT
jgi:peptide/nickel transport system permease protein